MLKEIKEKPYDIFTTLGEKKCEQDKVEVFKKKDERSEKYERIVAEIREDVIK